MPTRAGIGQRTSRHVGCSWTRAIRPRAAVRAVAHAKGGAGRTRRPVLPALCVLYI